MGRRSLCRNKLANRLQGAAQASVPAPPSVPRSPPPAVPEAAPSSSSNRPGAASGSTEAASARLAVLPVEGCTRCVVVTLPGGSSFEGELLGYSSKSVGICLPGEIVLVPASAASGAIARDRAARNKRENRSAASAALCSRFKEADFASVSFEPTRPGEDSFVVLDHGLRGWAVNATMKTLLREQVVVTQRSNTEGGSHQWCYHLNKNPMTLCNEKLAATRTSRYTLDGSKRRANMLELRAVLGSASAQEWSAKIVGVTKLRAALHEFLLEKRPPLSSVLRELLGRPSLVGGVVANEPVFLLCNDQSAAGLQWWARKIAKCNRGIVVAPSCKTYVPDRNRRCGKVLEERSRVGGAARKPKKKVVRRSPQTATVLKREREEKEAAAAPVAKKVSKGDSVLL